MIQKIEIDYLPYEYQEKFHADISRFRLVIGGRRVGKSKCFIQEALKHCLTMENALCWWVAPTFQEAKEIGWEEFMMHQETLKPLIHSLHHSQLRCQFINGSRLYFKSADNPDSLRGRGLTFLVCDEVAFMKEGIWGPILRPALSDRKGSAVFGSTPNGRNWIYNLYNTPSWSKFHWTTNMNPAITPEELESVKSEISEIDFRQEYMAEFITKAGRVYDDFNEENILNEFKLTDEYDIYLGADFGFAHPTAIGFFGVHRDHAKKVVQFDEIYETRHQMEEIISLIYLKLEYYGLNKTDIKAIYTDPAGNAEELNSGTSPVDTMRMHPHDLPVINKASRINPGLAQVRSFIKNAKGERRFFVTSNCKQTIRSFEGYQYASSQYGVKEEPLKDNINDHACDQVRYFFVNRFDTNKYVATKLAQHELAPSDEFKKIAVKCEVCKKPFLTSIKTPPFVCGACKDK